MAVSGAQKKRGRRRERIAAAHVEWADEDFGLSLERDRRGGGDRLQVIWRLNPDPVLSLMAVPHVLQLVAELEREWVLVQREAGDSWDDIGWCLGISGETLRRRHGKAMPGSGVA